jgi:hypothetical protein
MIIIILLITMSTLTTIAIQTNDESSWKLNNNNSKDKIAYIFAG